MGDYTELIFEQEEDFYKMFERKKKKKKKSKECFDLISKGDK